MENVITYGEQKATKEEFFASGHRACLGCAEALAVRLTCKALGRNIIIVNATGCMEVISSQLPRTAWRVPWIHTLFENTAAVASGVESGLIAMIAKGKREDKGTKVVAMGGDGGTSDIGFQALSGALERGHNFAYFCFDNEAYMNTGIQRSSATPFGASTTTTPASKDSIGQVTWKKNMTEIAVAHNIPYVTTACPSYPFDLMNKVKKAVAVKGPAYVHVLSPCPTGWRCAPDQAIEIGRLAVQTRVFPLYEVENGRYKFEPPPVEPRPVKDYFKGQGRFRHLSEATIAQIQERVDREYFKLVEKTEMADLS
ncbi:MAG: pyruvate synthase subunit PorB [Chloroflexota bacterium]